ncbi:protein inscuteable homolog isoform X1 [Tetranychus urticae]|uniref:protein inscuteable homolog isoform X1 n=1 Tax=Tetranychus urticae TaxID=32264 RepID=UPI00077BF14E|nr:protein inscuteable homolog isoform X1 [Tetranychus urticae]
MKKQKFMSPISMKQMIYSNNQYQTQVCTPSLATSKGAVNRGMPGPGTCVGQWLIETRRRTEMESLSALQAKSVAFEQDSARALGVRCAQISVRKVRFASVQIIDDIDILIDTLPVTCQRLRDCQHDFGIIYGNIVNLIDICARKRPESELKILFKIGDEVRSICGTLNLFMTDFMKKNKVNNAQLEAYLRKLKERLGELVDSTIRWECQIITSGLNRHIESLTLKWSLFALWQLTKNDAYICRIFVQDNCIINRLIKIIASNIVGKPFIGQDQIRAAAFRTLTHLCINPEAIRTIYDRLDMDKHIIIPLQREMSEIVIREITGFLVQITTPFIDYKRSTHKDSYLASFINGTPLDELISSLIKVATETDSHEIFLLITASIANISFYEPELIIRSRTLSILMATTRSKTRLSADTAIKDQIITIMANVSSIDSNEIVKCGALIYLITALQMKPINVQGDEVELAAIERIQQKVSTALTRLASNQNVAGLIYELKGCHRLVQICKEPRERNFSETVLIASLIALRRLCSMLKPEKIKELNAVDLITVNLDQAFLQCSQVSESYV